MKLNQANRLLTGLVLITTLALTGCGFKLRGSQPIPDELRVMRLDSVDKYSELARLLRDRLVLNNIKLVGNDSDAVASLTLYKDKLNRRTLSLFPNGQVAEYELIYSIKYAINVPQNDLQLFEFEIYRDYQDDPQSALAKSKELKLILKEMRQQAANKIVRQLASLNRTGS
jgi:LPS-assembly lipoprotein